MIAFGFARLSGSLAVPNQTKGLAWYLPASPAYHFVSAFSTSPPKVFGLPPLDEWPSITTTTPFDVRPCTRLSMAFGSAPGVVASRTALMPGKVFRIVAASAWPRKVLIPRAMNGVPSGPMIWPFATENWPVAVAGPPGVPAAYAAS